MRIQVSTALLLCAACGGGRTMWPGDPALYGVDLVVTDNADGFAHASDLTTRVHRVFEVVANHFGYDPSLLGGSRVVVTGDFKVRCGGSAAVGCFDGDANTISVTTAGTICLEGTGLAHELFHYFLWVTTGDGDWQHSNPRWQELGEVNFELQGGDPVCAGH